MVQSFIVKIIALLCFISLLSGCTAEKAADKPEGEHVVTVDVAPVLSTSISLKVTSDALLYPLQQASIIPKISAPVKKFYVDRGVRVKTEISPPPWRRRRPRTNRRRRIIKPF
ncbi:MAG: hypothetical protein DMG19_19800 [Acidobacteria bacterium]|nr:MAG: hypothetical protein DMG19_19800 [Acidobacteriota bacterium]